MRSTKLFSLIVLLIIAVSATAINKISSYTGEWKLNREETTLGNSQLFLSKITINLKNDSLYTARTYENGNGEEYPFTEILTLDGKEHKITIYDLPRKAKAYWSPQDGSMMIETTTTFIRDSVEENAVSKETWKVDETGRQLTADYTINTSDGEVKGTLYFNRSN